MLQPRSFTITAWAKVIAASVSASMDEFRIPKPPVPPQAQMYEVNIYLDMISYFEGLKRPSILPMELISMAHEILSGSSNAAESYNISSDSDQQLKTFQDLILDVMISYVIFKEQATLGKVSPNLTEKSKCVKKRNTLHYNNQNASAIIHSAPQAVTSNSDNEFQVETAKKKFVEYRSHHNSLPFVYYLILGVKGLFTAQKDHCNFSIYNAMLILCSFHLIHQHVKPPPLKEPVWKNLSFHLKSFFSKGMKPFTDVQLVFPPSQHQLAQYLTSDFLNQLEAQATVTSLLPPLQILCFTSSF
ncbi:hypothetical protein O181_126677 [Austropuccinia psidii MF-1]|uniref:Uncharacterized protein n=1 Tax=Austropuccinia psidii MF-1 TaxID=1389203 RepID=A0A9Q3KTU9_9BASI|nr:hypothetical protein [Austropuccinia psidii MF-1]